MSDENPTSRLDYEANIGEEELMKIDSGTRSKVISTKRDSKKSNRQQEQIIESVSGEKSDNSNPDNQSQIVGITEQTAGLITPNSNTQNIHKTTIDPSPSKKEKKDDKKLKQNLTMYV